MVQINFAQKSVTVKVVYYGPALSGKTTNLQAIHRLLNPAGRGRLMTLETRDDRTRGLFAMLDVVPRLRAARTPDGALQWQLAGTFAGSMRSTAAGSMRMGR